MVRAFLHYGMMGGVAIEMRVVLIEFGVVFIGGWGYLTLYTPCPKNDTRVILNILYSCKSVAMKVSM